MPYTNLLDFGKNLFGIAFPWFSGDVALLALVLAVFLGVGLHLWKQKLRRRRLQTFLANYAKTVGADQAGSGSVSRRAR